MSGFQANQIVDLLITLPKMLVMHQIYNSLSNLIQKREH